MSLPTNNKKAESQKSNNQKNQGKGSKFIQTGGGKSVTVAKKVRATSANRGS